MDSFPDVVVIEDLDFNIVAVNEVAESLLGYKSSELIGEPVKRFYADPEDYENRETEALFKGSDKDAITFETRYQKSDGGILEAETILKKIANNNGDIIGYLGVARDITERKQAKGIYCSTKLNINSIGLCQFYSDRANLKRKP